MDLADQLPYRYQPLNPDIQEIRILEVLPLQTGSTSVGHLVDCRVRHVRLDQEPKPQYHTVSYVWGNSARTSSVVIDGRVLHVPESTAKALWWLSTGHNYTRIWIDAVCINQDDIEERGRQVGLMADIYKHGVANVVFLGEQEQLTRRAVANIQEIRQEILCIRPNSNEDWWKAVHEEMPDQSKAYFFSSKPLGTAFDVEALCNFYSNPWFTRLWVAQEVVLATKNICVNGSMEFDFLPTLEVAAALCICFQPFTPRQLLDASALKHASQLWYLLHTASTTDSRSVRLFRAIAETRGLKCSNPRDTVFGLLGMTERLVDALPQQTLQELLRADYKKPVAQVHRDATRFCLLQTGDVNILHRIMHQDNADAESESVSSWSLPFGRESVDGFNHLETGKLKFTRQADFQDANARTDTLHSVALRVPGFTVDRISETSQPLASNGLSDGTTFFKTCRNLIAQHAQPAEDWTFGRTLTAGLNSRRQPWSEQDQKDLDSFYEYAISNHDAIHLLEDNAQISDTQYDLSLRQASRFYLAMKQYSMHRKVVKTVSGRIALAPKVARPGDVIVILRPSRNPWAFRPTEAGHYRFLGDCYVDWLRTDDHVAQFQKDYGREDGWFEIH